MKILLVFDKIVRIRIQRGQRITDPDLEHFLGTSVADPGCLSRILIFTHPGSRISDPGSRIPDPGFKNSNKREVKKN